MSAARLHPSLVLLPALALGLAACAATGSGEPAWEPVVCYEASAAVERIRCGHPDPADVGLQAVSVDQAGDVALVRFPGGAPRARVIYRHGCELTGLAISDIDPAVPGEEIYVGGFASGEGREGVGGAVLQLVVTAGAQAARVRRIWEGPAYVHSVERVEPQSAGEGPRLLVATYEGELHLLAPTAGDGPWADRLLHREPPSDDPEAVKIKDVGFLRDPSGRPPHEALVAFKTGRLLLLDLTHPERARTILDEPGGLSRVTPDADGGAYVTGYFGRVLHYTRAADGLQLEVVDQEGADSGLRGVVLGDFPVDGTTAHLVLFGFHKLCRALVPRQGVLDPVTLYVDVDRGHTIEAADLVPGNGADELLLGGYSLRMTMLVARP
jgi:hypothetical protein